MHEVSLVMDLVERCEELARGRNVTIVRLRRSVAVDDNQLREIFRACVDGTILAAARLEIEHQPLELGCPCGFRGALAASDIVQHIAVCPSCGAISPVPPGSELQLIGLSVA